jgi:hypothetical protein
MPMPSCETGAIPDAVNGCLAPAPRASDAKDTQEPADPRRSSTYRTAVDLCLLARRRLNPQRNVVAGGQGAVSDAAFAQLKALVGDTVRVGGTDRYDTSRQVAEHGIAAGMSAG